MRIIKRIAIGLAIVVAALALITILFMQQKSFGKLPSGQRLERIKKSPQYRDGAFQNVEHTEMMMPDVSYPSMIYKFFFGSIADGEPSKVLPAVKTDIKNISREQNSITWFGHSSYLLVFGGKFIMIDPVFSQRASPVQFAGSKAFPAEYSYTIDDFPELDAVIITHDHYDHLDYHSIVKLRSKANIFITSLGVGEHLVYWGIDESKIVELDWWESTAKLEGIHMTATPARHFSGRGFKRNQSLWSSFVLNAGNQKIFVGGDSGYDGSFRKIGERFGPFDFAILECGQYNEQWPYIHMMPEQTVQASIDLKANVLLPVHWGKFKLSFHPWYEPIQRAYRKASEAKVSVATPLIGEVLALDTPKFGNTWWERR